MKLSLSCFTSLLFFLFSTIAKVSAQEFGASGVLFEDGATIRIALAEISNYRTNVSVGSNDMGMFEIKVKIGDTLLVTKRGFNNREVVVRDTKAIIVKLNRDNLLNEVTIFGQTKTKTLNDIKQDYRDKGSFYAGKPPLLSYFFTPLTALYELFGKTPRNARRFNKYYATELQQSEIDVYFNKAYIANSVPIPTEKLDDYMIYNRPAYEVAKNWTEYDLKSWIVKSYKKYADSLKLPVK